MIIYNLWTVKSCIVIFYTPQGNNLAFGIRNKSLGEKLQIYVRERLFYWYFFKNPSALRSLKSFRAENLNKQLFFILAIRIQTIVGWWLAYFLAVIATVIGSGWEGS